jgi:glucose/arabinose dehydrogenase
VTAGTKSRRNAALRSAWNLSRVPLLLALTTSCGGGAGDAADPLGPPQGKQDGEDFADQECLVTLRETKADAAGEKLVGSVDYDKAELDSGSKPFVAFTTVAGSNDPKDFKHICRNSNDRGAGGCVGTLKAATSGLEGLTRFTFEIEVDDAAEIELIPYIELSGGRGRGWDHNRPENDQPQSFRPNRREGQFNDNYVAAAPNFAIALDESTCPRGGGCKLPGVAFSRAYAGVPLRDPTSIKWEPNTPTRRVFVSEKLGRIVAFPDRDDAKSSDAIVKKSCGGTLGDGEACVFLDWTSETYKRGGRFGNDAPGWEEGFLDFEFHPQWPQEPFVFITFNSGVGDPEDLANRGSALWNLVRLESKDNGKTLDVSTAKTLIKLEKKGLTHNAGAMFFHPDDDNRLYVSIGTDGGFPFDKFDHSQDPNELFGTVVRMEVIETNEWTAEEREQGFRVPRDNPFANGTTGGQDCKPGEFRTNPACLRAANPLVWVYGTRNPWGMTLDRPTGKIYGAEVGENQREELNTYEAGKNYGYPLFEGDVCTGRGRCNNAQFLEAPEFVMYASDQARPDGTVVGDSITGGFVYRGKAMPDLVGKYVFGDFISGAMFFWDPARPGTQPQLLENTGKSIARFGQNPEGELFFLDHRHQEFRVEGRPAERVDGGIYRVEAGACKSEAPPPAVTYAFLSADGVGDEESANAYYRTNLSEVATRENDGQARTTDNYTLAQWKRDFAFDELETLTDIYKNEWDLAFFRDMTCTKEIGPGRGGCAVTNWNNVNREGTHLGTVCMNVSQEGFVQFWVFGDGGQKGEEDDVIQPFAILDDENADGPDDSDKKFVPNVCTPCHGGTKYRINGPTDLGSVFREFEPGLLLTAAANDASEGRLRGNWKVFNNAVLSANEALNTRTPMIDYIQSELYPNGPDGAGDAVDSFGRETLPESWNDDAGGDEELAEAKRSLWSNLVYPYCMTCHRIRKIEVDFTEYDRFQGLGEEKNGEPGLYTYISGSSRPGKTEGHPIFMPQTQHLYDRLNGNSADAEIGEMNPTDPLGRNAKDAIVRWLKAVNKSAPTCSVTFRVRTGNETQIGEDVFLTGQVGDVDSGELGSWQPWDGVKLLGTENGTLWTNEQPDAANEVLGPVEIPQGREILFQAVIVDSRQQTRNECNDRPKLRWQNPAFENESVVIDSGENCTQVVELDLRDRGFGNAFCE